MKTLLSYRSTFWRGFGRIVLMLCACAALPVLSWNMVQAQTINPDAYQAMQWRQVGPYRAGWATMTSGVPGEPNTFYFGGAGGGVWKTTNAGLTWKALMQHQESSAVGAIAVSSSDPNVIYVGTGQVTMRYDNMAGDGVYKSEDGGKTWRNMGLNDTRHIGRIAIDPHNPDHVLVAAMGHMYDSNTERGVYMTEDGGKSWKRVLYVDDKTGAIDLAMDPDHPSVVYAAMWQMQLHPWLDYFMPQAGPGSGIYKSTDGGSHWRKLRGNGLPGGDLGRIGLAVKGSSVYASVISASGQIGTDNIMTGGGSGLYRSTDSGAHWHLVNTDPELTSSYFSRITVAPDNPNKVYVMGRSIHMSTDGGHHFTIIKGSPGGDDYHFLWINPKYPDHMITGADQGAAVSVDGGKTWSSWYNQPTGQFYHIAVDDQFPYHIYSGQQDNGTVDIKSRGPYGVIEERDWHPVGGDERDYMVPKPGNPEIVFGSGLGGHVSRFDEVTRQSDEVSPWPVSSYGARPEKVKYRYTWITPLVFSPVGDHAMYLGAQVLFKSVDNGDHWSVISPDLSGKKQGAKGCKIPDREQARNCGFGVIYTIAPSPVSENVIWVGMDDGLIQLTTDGGKNWKNVTPQGIPAWGRIDAISPSHFSVHTAYAAVDMHRLGQFRPMIYKTTDDGQHWEEIINGLPDNEYSTVVRSDPKQPGLLFAGTNRSVYVSFDDGTNWQPLTQNFPTTWVRDLQIHDNDLIAGTQGRGIWVMDDIEPLRELAAQPNITPDHLFKPARAWRLRANENKDTPPPPETPLGQNPPTGAIFDYLLKGSPHGPVTITVRDQNGSVVRRFSSKDKPENLPASRYFQKGWIREPQRISTLPGMHRFVWDLRYPRPKATGYGYSIAAVWHDGTPLTPEGALILPGEYTVTLTVDGKSQTEPLTVRMDPRVHVSEEALKEQLDLAQSVDSTLSLATSTSESISRSLQNAKKAHATAMSDSLSEIGHRVSGLAGVLSSLSGAVQSADAAPTQGQKEVFKDYRSQLNGLLQRLQKIK